jgi:hypothetical protein
MRWRIAALGALVLAVIAFAWSARPRALEFASSFEVARGQAKREGAWIVAHVRRGDRPLGVKMDEETLAAREIRVAGHDGFVHVRVDAEKETELAERLAGRGAALSVVVTDASGEVLAQLPGFASGDTLATFLQRVRARRSKIEGSLARLAKDGGDVAARLDLAESLFALGATERAESEVERARRDADAPAAAEPVRALAPRALSLQADLLEARGQDGEAARLRRELSERYPASPFAQGSRRE